MADELASWQIALIPVVVALVGFLVCRSKTRAAQDQGRYHQLKEQYQATLDHLANHPLDPYARVRCLEAGRRFYARVHPDSYDQDVSALTSPASLLGVGRSNFQDNTAAREAKIMSDIEARVGHLKL